MTTVVCDRSVMIGDRQADDGITHEVRKVYAVKGHIIGFCGSLEDGLMFVDWYFEQGRKPHMDADFGALVLTPGGIYAYEPKLVREPIAEKFTAIGSGAALAIGAMEHGATPLQAIKIAARRDSGTSNRFNLRKLPVPK